MRQMANRSYDRIVLCRREHPDAASHGPPELPYPVDDRRFASDSRE
jgi:hypothetical protein